MTLAVDLEVTHLKVQNDSLLVTDLVTEAFSTKDEMLDKYLSKVLELSPTAGLPFYCLPAGRTIAAPKHEETKDDE